MASDQNDQEKIKVLVVTLDDAESLKSSWVVAKALLKRGNDVYFAQRQVYKSLCDAVGFKFIAFEDIDPNVRLKPHTLGLQSFPKLMIKTNMPPLERLKDWTIVDSRPFVIYLSGLRMLDSLTRKVMKILKPDIIVSATIYPLPLSMQDQIPVIPIYCSSPIGLYYKSGLHPGTGFSVKSNKKRWEEFREKEKPIHEQLLDYFNVIYNIYGLEVENMHAHRNFARYFGIYNCPEALDYHHDLFPGPSNWVRFDRIYREPMHKFILPEPLASKPGKLIFIAIPVVTRFHMAIVNRLINTFSRSKHRFIVFLGPPDEQMKLPDNMWGHNDLRLMSCLSQVDMVISSAVNENIFEALYFAKPLIVMPLVPPQLDNAQRIEDLKLGFRMNPFTYDETDIHIKVETLLTDVDLQERIRKVSNQMRNSNNCAQIAEMIEHVARTKTSPI